MKKIKRTSIYFTFTFVLVTVLILSSLILIMIFDYQEVDNYVEIESQEEQSSEYWTQERMEEAKPQPMPTESKRDKLKELVNDILPVLIILFITLTAASTLLNMKRIKLLEKQQIEKDK